MLLKPHFAPPSSFQGRQQEKEADPQPHEPEEFNSDHSDFEEETNYHVVALPQPQKEDEETKTETKQESLLNVNQSNEIVFSSPSPVLKKAEVIINQQHSDWIETLQHQALAIGKSIGSFLFVSSDAFVTSLRVYFQIWKTGEWCQIVLAGCRDWVCAPLMDFLFSLLCLFVPWSDKFPLWIFHNSSGLISLFWSRFVVLIAVFLFAYNSLMHFLHLGSYLAALNATFAILSQARKNIHIQATTSPEIEIVSKRQKRILPKDDEHILKPNAKNANSNTNKLQPQMLQKSASGGSGKCLNSALTLDPKNKSPKKESKQQAKKKFLDSSLFLTMNALPSLCGIWLFYSFVSDFIDPHLEQKFLLYHKCLKTLILFLLTKKVATQINL